MLAASVPDPVRSSPVLDPPPCKPQLDAAALRQCIQVHARLQAEPKQPAGAIGGAQAQPKRRAFEPPRQASIETGRLSDWSDEDLLPLVQRDGLGALETLYERHRRVALALAWRVVGERETAEEVVQEAFLAVWQRASTYRSDRGAVRVWLLSIVRHRALDRIRREPRLVQLAELDALADHHTPEPWWEVNRRLRREQVVTGLKRLPPEQREVIDLAYYAGLTQQEIAERIGAPLGTVKGRMRLAMEKLRLSLAALAPDGAKLT